MKTDGKKPEKKDLRQFLPIDKDTIMKQSIIHSHASMK